jgi:hypothetical protein
VNGKMDAAQLNKINELAREYLRLGIAKSTTDAVEKARFQLSFDTSTKKVTESPYDVLFKGMPEETQKPVYSENENMTQKAVNETITINNNNVDRQAILEETRNIIRQHESRLSSQFMGLIDIHKKELEAQKAKILGLENDLMVLRRNIRDKENNQNNEISSPANTVISSTIEQTIKGRVVRADDVAIDKIFYFGNK